MVEEEVQGRATNTRDLGKNHMKTLLKKFPKINNIQMYMNIFICNEYKQCHPILWMS